MTAPKVLEHLDWIVHESMMFADDQSPFHAAMTPGAPRLAVVVGDNATGKSLLVRMLAGRLHDTDATTVSVSIRERVGGGTGEMARMAQAFIYGDEGDQSTGATSVRVVRDALESNTDKPNGCILVLDEPELGLAEGYAHALGAYIAGQSKTMSRRCGGVVVVTHSRALVAGIKDGLGRNPTFVTTATEPVTAPTVAKWLARQDTYGIDALLALPDTNTDRWRTINGLLRPHR